MAINHPQGILAVALGIMCFYGMTYVVIALNLGWRFGYWVAGATLSMILFLMSIFWVVTGLGPRGQEARWVPLAAAKDRIAQVSLNNSPLSAPASYPQAPWEPGTKANGLDGESEALNSGVQNCLTTPPAKLLATDTKPCTEGQALLPTDQDIPVINGSAVAMTPDLQNVRFTTDNGALIAEGTVVPLTRDPRVAKDVTTGAPLGRPFLILAVKNEGTLRVPAFSALGIFAVVLAFHLLGLHRAEERKISQLL